MPQKAKAVPRKLVYKKPNFDPAQPVTEAELTASFGEDKKKASYAGSKEKLKVMQDRNKLMSDMFEELKKPLTQPEPTAAASDISGEDGVWARAIIQKMARMTVDTKTDFKDYVDDIATKAARGKWVPDEL